MSGETVEQLFEEFAQAYLRGESPDVPAYLARARGGRDDLGKMIDRFLQAVPAQPATEEEVVLMRARLELEAPLLVLRRDRRRLDRGAVVDAIVSALGLDPAKRDKVADYYHRLETGLLDPSPVSARLWDALGVVLGANARALATAFRPPPLAAAPAHRRADEDFVLTLRAPAHPVEREEERDEIDTLFTGAA